MTTLKTYDGYVLFVLMNKDSKNEHFAPVLISEQGVQHQLHKETDNPFMQEGLRPFHLQFCEISGKLDEKNNILLVSEINKKTDPYIKAIAPDESDKNEATSKNKTIRKKDE